MREQLHERAGLAKPVIRSGVALVGSFTAVFAVIGVLQGDLADLHLRSGVKLELSVCLGILAALLVAARDAFARKHEEEALAQSLVTAFDGGVRKSTQERHPRAIGFGRDPMPNATSYRRRDCDDDLERAMRHGWLVCIVGPAGCGKSRAAFEALRRTRGQAKLLRPSDGVGLATLQSGQHQLLRFLANDQAAAEAGAPVVSRSSSKPVRRLARLKRPVRGFWAMLRRQLWPVAPHVEVTVWLDGLSRFLDGLDLDEVAGFLAHAEGRAKPGGGRPGASVRLVCTMRDKDLEDVLEKDDDASHRLRRVLDMAGVVRWPKLPDPASWPAVGAAAADPRSRETRTSEEPAGSDPRLRPPPEEKLKAFYSGVAIILALLVASAVFGVRLYQKKRDEGWQQPVSLADQATEILAGRPTCQAVTAGPTRSLHEGSDWVLVAHGGSCPEPDSVSLYTVESGRLVPVATEKPEDAQSWSFQCLKPEQCTSAAGGQLIVAGAFADREGHSLPLLLYRKGAGKHGVRVLAPPLPRYRTRPLLKAALSPGAEVSHAAKALAQCERGAQLCGYPADVMTAETVSTTPSLLDSGTSHKRLLLIVGYKIGPPSSDAVHTRAYALAYENSSMVFDDRPCLLYHAGERVQTTLHSGQLRRPAFLHKMRVTWRSGQVIC